MNLTVRTYRNLRLIRIIVSIVVACAIFAAVAAGYDLLFSRWQLVPAVLACSFSWVLLWLLVTAVVGRIYCSGICPIGTLLDVFGHLGHRRHPYFYSQPRAAIRRSITLIAVGAALAGIPVMLDLIDPAAAFSRMAAWSAAPLVRPVAFSVAGGVIALLSLAVLAAASYKRGRLICNTICPVGTVLAEISRFSLYHIDINTDKCIGCGRCTARCKAECIDPSAHTVDTARCVLCFDCTAGCPNSAITYRRGRHRLVMPLMQPAGGSRAETRRLDRRDFLAAVFGGLPAMAAMATPIDLDLEPLNRVHPPGLKSSDSLLYRCTGCGACSAACPAGIIRPADAAGSIRTPLRPVLEFDTGYCLYDCVRCTSVCPTGALTRLSISEKHRFVIGKARVVPRLCIEYNSGEGCGECARRCPRRTITIKPVEHPEASPGHPADRPELTVSGRQRRLPEVDPALCIGCGECRYVCPAHPKAFIIEGEQ